MKSLTHRIMIASVLCSSWASAQTDVYTNFIRQVEFPSGLEWDVTVPSVGTQLSEREITAGGARFELHTMKATPLTSYLLDSSFVGTYIPIAKMALRSEDLNSVVLRTRADRPFYVDVEVSGLLSGAEDPEPSKSVHFLHHVQSFGPGGTGVGLDRSQAALLTQSSITTNGVQNLTFAITQIPGADRSKVRGEERFAVFSLADYQAPASELAAQTIQVWPVADGTISGISQNQLIRFTMPPVTLALNDLYPSSTTYAQVYHGGARLGAEGTLVPGSALSLNDPVPQNRVLSLSNYDEVFDSDGRWTMEILTKTPFGIDRLAYVSFDLDRTIKMNSSFTTSE